MHSSWLTNQVLDDGRITDGQGRTVDFSNTIVVMTGDHGMPSLTSLSVTHPDEGGDMLSHFHSTPL